MRLKEPLLTMLAIAISATATAQENPVSGAAGAAVAEAPSVAATGVLEGRIVDAATGRALADATISIVMSGLFTQTDLNGYYRIEGVPVGSQEVSFFKAGYRYITNPGLLVSKEKAAKYDVALEKLSESDDTSDIVFLQALEVTAEVVQGSDIELIEVRQGAAGVSDAIGGDSFSRFGLGDAASAMSKVTGATVMDGKYVFIRGLGDRYTNTKLNNATVPSADPDRRAVQFDQFPSDLLDAIVTSKSFTADMPGDFAGGSVNLKTKAFPSSFFFSLGATGAYNTVSTGEDILANPNGIDALAFGVSDREAPALTPEILAITSVSQAEFAARGSRFAPGDPAPMLALDAFSKGFQQGFFASRRKADPDYGLAAAIGDQVQLGGERRFGYTASLTYDRSTSHYDAGISGRYSALTSDASIVQNDLLYSPDLERFSFGDAFDGAVFPWEGETPMGVTRSKQAVSWSGFTKLSFQPSREHEFSLDVLHNQSAEDVVRRGYGEARGTRSSGLEGLIYMSYDNLYTERGVTSIQLSGKSQFSMGPYNPLLSYQASFGRSTQDQPDFQSVQALYDVANAQWSTNTTTNPTRNFRYLDERNNEYRADLQIPGLLGDDRQDLSLKTGVLYSDTEREYEEQIFNVARTGNSDKFVSWEQLTSYYAPGTVGVQTLEPVQGSNPHQYRAVMGWAPILVGSNSQLGTQEVTAGYAQLDWSPLPRWRLISGVRLERTEIFSDRVERNVVKDDYDVAEISQTDVLPALSVVYKLGESMNLRAAYGRTLARPTFKELSSPRIFDPFNLETYLGNPDLKMSQIDNLDLRWEWFRGNNQLFAVSLFHKQLKDPIEVTYNSTLQSGTGAILQPQNADEGEVYGIEFEMRYNLGELADLLDPFTLGFNFAWTESEVTLPEDEYAALVQQDPLASRTRRLYGQADYVANFDLSYDNSTTGTSLTLRYNVTGERLVLVTQGPLGDVFEQPAPRLDLIAAQRLGKGWKLKVAATNLLDPHYEQLLENRGQDLVFERYRKGITLSVGFSYLFQ